MKEQEEKYNIKVQKLYKQSAFEACLTLVLYFFYAFWWWFFIYYFGDKNFSEYNFILGLPAWFFYGVFLGYPFICILLWFVITRYFKDIALYDSLGVVTEKVHNHHEKHTEIL